MEFEYRIKVTVLDDDWARHVATQYMRQFADDSGYGLREWQIKRAIREHVLNTGRFGCVTTDGTVRARID